MLIGLIKWFDSDKSFGVVGNPEEGEFFFHINNFVSKPSNLSKGTALVFKKRIDTNKNRNSAENCRLLGKNEDWSLIINYLGIPDILTIESDTYSRDRRGRSIRGKVAESFSLMELSTEQLFKDKNSAEISNIITGYFDQELDKSKFIAYCEFFENSIVKLFDIEKAKNLLILIFKHFGKNLNEEILFHVWKNKKFKFISYDGNGDYEIPEKVLNSFENEISPSDLQRIKAFTFGPTFCTKFINTKFSSLISLSSIQLKSLYPFLEFTTEEEELKKSLDTIYFNTITKELIEKANEIYPIRNDNDLYYANKIFNLVPEHIRKEKQEIINSQLSTIISTKFSEEFKPKAWIKGLIDEPPFEFILKYFLDSQTIREQRTEILSKVSLNQKLDLLIWLSKEQGWEKAFDCLDSLVRKENSFGNGFVLSENLYDYEFWNDKKLNDLVVLFIEHFNKNVSEIDKYELFFKGLTNDIPLSLVIQNIDKLDSDDVLKIFNSQSNNIGFILEVLLSKISNSNTSVLKWVYDLANQYLDIEKFDYLDKNVFTLIPQNEYFVLWKNGKAKILPTNYIEEYFIDNEKRYKDIEKWIETELITREEIANILFSYLKKQIPATDRIVFYKQFIHVKYLLQTENQFLPLVRELKNDFYQLILWVLGKEQIFDFEFLKQKFIYFSPAEQVFIIRKLFGLKATNQFDLTIDKINEIRRFDLDLFQTNQIVNPTLSVDISTDIIIKALISYSQSKKFLVESELLNIVLDDLKNDKTRRFKLDHYFQICNGRMRVDFNWTSEGTISKVPFNDDQYYFGIKFPTGNLVWVNSRRGGYNSFRPNPNFEDLKNGVKRLPGSKWNAKEEHWGIPSKYEMEVLEFGKEHRFTFLFEGNKYANNIHLAKFERKEIPNGVFFCAGRLANKPHENYNKNFWWCNRQHCFENCETLHNSDQWEKYTLLDFCEILELNTDEISNKGDLIPKGHYYQFIGLINRFNNLLDKLYCRDCNEILYPVESSNFAAYTVVRFSCNNMKCKNKEEVYLNHCLNGQCNNIIDSRVSKKCNNGLYICDICGSCCSHDMLNRRLTNLLTVGSYIHPNLTRCVNGKLGHLERAEYFCYKCADRMEETNDDIFHCKACNIDYDTTIYKFKRPNKYIETSKDNQIEEHDLDLPF